MGILNQLYDLIDSNTRDPSTAPVDTHLTQDEWVVATTSMASHQLLRNGFDPASQLGGLLSKKVIPRNLGSDSVSETLSRPELGTIGTINTLKTFNMLDSWEKIVVSQQLAEISDTAPTAEDFIDGGIKRGSKIVISVVKEDNDLGGSPYNIIKSSLKQTIDGRAHSMLFDKFSVVNYTEPDEARFQIHETFGADIIQSFGRRPRIMMISGIVLNGKARIKVNGEIRSMDWKNAFQRFYENYASLHRNVMDGHKVRIYAQDTVFDGYLLNMMTNTTSETQSASQVTISFVISKKYSPRENDSAIPGYTNESGFRITSATTPDEIFPEALLAHHFGEDPLNILRVARENAYRDLDAVAGKIISLDSGFGAEPELDRNNDLYVFSDESQYFTPAVGLRLHKLLTGGQIEDALKSHVEEANQLRDDIVSWNGGGSGVDSGVSIEINGIPPDIATNDAIAEEKLLRQKQSFSRSRQVGLKKLAEEINGLAEEYVRTSNYINHLETL